MRKRILLASVVAFAIVNMAEASDVRQETNIPAQSLSSALRTLAKDRNEDLIFATGDIGALSTKGASGNLTIDEALDQLLRDSGLTYRRLDEKTISILPATPAASADMQSENTVIVEGTTINDPILSSRTGDTLRERPQSVTVVTRERLDEQNLNSVADALDQATGITVTNVSYTTQSFYSRGFEISNIQLDGGSPFSFNNFGYNQLPDLAIYEQVEVLRGADALFSGNGQPGGTIQLVRKRPTKNAQAEVAASVSRYGSHRGQLDVSGPLAFDGRLRGRAVYVNEDLGSFQRVQDSTRDLIYGTLEADLTDSTELMVGATHDKRIAPHGGFGLPRYADGRDLHLPRSTVLSADWARFDTTTTDMFARLDQRIGNDWSLRLNYTRTRQEMRNLKQYAYGAVDPETGLIGAMYGSDEQFTPTQNLADVTLKGSFELFGRTHKVAIGADWQDIKSGGNVWGLPMYSNIDPFRFDPYAYPQPGRTVIPSQKVTWNQKQNGAYVSLSLQLFKPFRLLGGARYSNYEYEYGYDFFNTTTGAGAGSFSQRYQDNDVVTPYVGFTYEINDNWTGYGSYAESFESQASYIKSPFPGGDPLEPKTGDSLEFGIKGGLWDGRAATQAAVYRILRRNEAVLDLGVPPVNLNGINCCYLAQGVVESRGIDLEINGVLLRGWTMFAGYTFNENKYKSGYGEGSGAVFMPQTPKHLFKLWTTYQLPGAWSQLKLSAGLNLQTRNYVSGTVVTYDPITGVGSDGTPYSFSQGGYSLVSLRAEYAFNDNWSASLNVTNLFDKTYYQTVGSTTWANWYGAPRSYAFGIRGKF